MDIKMIYVFAPANLKTGGIELAHQLVKILTDKNIPCTIAYVGIKEGINPINEEYKMYVNKYVSSQDVPDEEGTVVIVPEIYTLDLVRFTKSKKIIWWMSVDNFEMYCGIFQAIKHCGVWKTIKHILKGRIKNKRYSRSYADMHLYQSEYARLYLKSAGFENAMPLSDYINDSFFDDFEVNERRNIVLYNPKKGFSFTKKIMKAFPCFEWKAIENMTTDEVVDLLKKSKVYIDFGNHPGKDRFPREAAISGCCIITGKRGAAANNVDVMIPENYKFEDDYALINHIGEKIQYCIESYDSAIADFELYRKKIREEKKMFMEEVDDVVKYLEGI